MENRRIVGMDLGVVSDHVVAICDETGTALAKRRRRPTKPSLETIEAAALAGAPEGTRLEVVIEPTGAAWMPVAVFFCRRGHTVYRVSSQKAADLRRFLSRHAKSNAIDAETLARLAIVDPEHLVTLELPGAELAALNRRARAADALTDQITNRKTRLRELACHAMPGVAPSSPTSWVWPIWRYSSASAIPGPSCASASSASPLSSTGFLGANTAPSGRRLGNCAPRRPPSPVSEQALDDNECLHRFTLWRLPPALVVSAAAARMWARKF